MHKPDFFLSYPSVIKLTLYELISITLFLVILMVYENPHFLAQALAINVFVLGIYFLVPNLIMNRVDIALYKAKESGRNVVVVECNPNPVCIAQSHLPVH